MKLDLKSYLIGVLDAHQDDKYSAIYTIAETVYNQLFQEVEDDVKEDMQEGPLVFEWELNPPPNTTITSYHAPEWETDRTYTDNSDDNEDKVI